MFKVLRGVIALLALAAAPTAVLTPSVVQAQANPPSAFDTRLATQAPLDIPHAPPSASTFFPARAQRMETSGQAVIDCAADAAGALSDCQLVSETPGGWGFGAAAIGAAQAGAIRQAATTDGRALVSVAFDARRDAVDSSAPGKRVPPLRVAGPPVVAQAAGPDQTLVTFPFTFNRTGVLTADATGYSIWVKGVLAPAGSAGFYAGNFHWPLAKTSGEVWCFPASPPKAAKALCLMLVGKLAIILPDINPYVITSFASSSGTFNFANAPAIEEKSVAIPGDLSMEYRFRRWKDSRALVEELAGGRRATLLDLPLGEDGRAKLHTLAGDYWLRPAPGDPTRVDVSPAAP